MAAFKLAWYAWLALAGVAIGIHCPMYALLPTLYMPIVSLILYRKFGYLSFRAIKRKDREFSRRLAFANLMFVVLNGAAIAQFDHLVYSAL